MTDRINHPRIAMVGSYVPRQCGIATFSHNLSTAIGSSMGAQVSHRASDNGDGNGVSIVAMNDQAIFSLADIQFVLHHLADTADVEVTLKRAGRSLSKTLRLDRDWRRNDFTWRVSLSDFASSPGYYLRMLRAREKSRLDLDEEELALEVEGLFTPVARASGLEKGDIIVGVDGRKAKLSAPKFHAYLRVQHSTPTTIARMTVLRNRERREIEVRFFE